MNDAELVRRTRQGDLDAWEALMQAYQQPVFRFACLLLGDADEAEDVAQETFIRAYRSLASFDLERAIRPWLLQITANLARNRQRSAGRYLQALRRWSQSEPAPTTTLGERSGPQWESQVLRQAVQRLTRTDQEMIYLRYFLDLSERETADALGIAAGTVKSRTHRALQHLRSVVDTDFPVLAEERQA